MALAVVAVSCEKPTPTPTPGPDHVDPQDPLENCVLPETVKAGGEALVQWDGFKENAQIVLKDGDSKEYPMQVKVVTAYGLTFKVPAKTPAGLYLVVLIQESEITLGKITVTPADMPVTGLKVPAGAEQGETVIIEGIGFEEGCGVVAVDQADQEHSLESEVTYLGLSVVIPADLAEGEYALYLLQDEMRWLLASSFSVYKELVVKQLSRIDYYTEYSGEAMLRITWEISRETPVTLTVSESVVEGDVVELNAYDQYVQGEDGFFTLVNDGLEISNNIKMSYTRDFEGKVTVADVLRYDKEDTTPFTWTYDQNGFLTDISSTKSLCSFEYTDGNMTAFGGRGFEFADPSLVNNPAAPDVIWGYMSLMNITEPFMYVPYFLGWYSKASAQLPTAMIVPSPTGTGTDTYPLTYDFDEDGYVVRMTLGSEKVEYIFSASAN
ncbi:MAG: hypothetical protein IKW55_00620 [Bacteroidales bacterium]|nr:hypothetical protein [Bacteroidales bacterium]